SPKSHISNNPSQQEIVKIKAIFQDLKRDLKILNSQKDQSEISTETGNRLRSFFNGFLTSPHLLSIRKIYCNNLKLKTLARISGKISTNYKISEKEFKRLISFIRIKEYECWKLRSSHLRNSLSHYKSNHI